VAKTYTEGDPNEEERCMVCSKAMRVSLLSFMREISENDDFKNVPQDPGSQLFACLDGYETFNILVTCFLLLL
jgi:hypothetical protein